MKISRFTFYSLAFLISGLSCGKSYVVKPVHQSGDSLAILAYQVNSANAQVTINSPSIYVQFPDSVTDPGNLVATFSLTPRAVASINGIQQTSGITGNNFARAMIYTLTATGGRQTDWEVIGTNNSYTFDWGLGQWLLSSVSNNRSYNWYID